jgi:tetratricopeptide (TPR) repeat protein
MQMSNIGEILSDQGRIDEAEELFADVERVCDQAGQRLMSTVARGNLGRAAARAGRFDDAEPLLADALAGFREINAASFALETEMRLAELDVLRGDRPEEALVRTRAVLEVAEDAADMAALHASALRLRAAARLQLGDAAAAEPDLDESIVTARRGDALYEVALALDLKGAAGDAAAAAESAELLQRLGVERVARPPFGASGVS